MIMHIADASTVHADWVKSSRSSSNGACLEVAAVGEGIALRNSREPAGPALLLTVPEFAAFAEGSKAGEFDRYYLQRGPGGIRAEA
ncbi:hypothetical protein J2S43_007843 [Catenuloplanes nepalensis]|uniref:DUF397 domain-containing protein n=1 Tax=Catenuloplanes nepalensis TaxID=587533 RepID=A0ABT9N6K5_9ACTN|nr:DUF397 domain-containing protein [Catenuloplanes nepalensis]MDP9799331.1 hypothetical protein [Catenuloplanes nepalensis]